jgi:hypothetical protein
MINEECLEGKCVEMFVDMGQNEEINIAENLA